MTQAQWLAELQEWVGTPFRWQGRVKQDGADCWGLIICASHECGYIPKTWDVSRYSRRDDLVALSHVNLPLWFDEVTGQDWKAGDVLAFHKGQGILHLGVLYDHRDGGFGIVHTEDYRRIVAHGLTADAAKQVAQVWRPRYDEDGK